MYEKGVGIKDGSITDAENQRGCANPQSHGRIAERAKPEALLSERSSFSNRAENCLRPSRCYFNPSIM